MDRATGREPAGRRERPLRAPTPGAPIRFTGNYRFKNYHPKITMEPRRPGIGAAPGPLRRQPPGNRSLDPRRGAGFQEIELITSAGLRLNMFNFRGTLDGMDGDVGLFGPDSVTWKLHEEPILLLGGLRSLYLQALHPRAVAGVAQNSTTAPTRWGRLNRTSDYVGTVVYGSTARSSGPPAGCAGMHSRMTATDPRTGETFRIDEPDLLRWVHVTEVESFLTTARRAGLKLTDDEVDAYYTEQLRGGRAGRPGPGDRAGHRRRGGRLLRGDAARAGRDPGGRRDRALPDRAAGARTPGAAGRCGLGLTLGPPRWAYFGIAGTAFALLPPWARKMYGGLGWPTTDLSADLSVRGMRLLLQSVLAAAPKRYRTPPMRRAALARAGLA